MDNVSQFIDNIVYHIGSGGLAIVIIISLIIMAYIGSYFTDKTNKPID